MPAATSTAVRRLVLTGFGVTLAALLGAAGVALHFAPPPQAQMLAAGVGALLVLLGWLALRLRAALRAPAAPDGRNAAAPLLKAEILQHAVSNSVHFYSIATDARGVIQIFSAGAERMFGYRAEEVVNRATPDSISDRAELVARASALSSEWQTPIQPGFDALVFKASRGIEDLYQLTYIRKDGSRLPAIVSVTALRDPQGGLIGYLLFGTDDTARKRVELTLQEKNIELEGAKAAADKANLAKSEFLSSMSHELRTPLNAVLGFAQLMASETPPPSAQQQRSIDQILKGGWYLLRLINEILDLAMIESGKVTMSQEAVSLVDVLRDCESMIAPQAQQRQIRMSFPSAENLFYVHADRTRVKQVMLNLLANAIKYNRDGGAIVVECAMSGEGRVRVSVRDTGNGLAPEQLAQLFQPFNRLGQEAGAVEGSGIGLVVTKQLVELMGGLIGVASHVGIGTVFWVELEATSAPTLVFDQTARDGGGAVSEPEHAAQRRTLLYVEDNPANLVLVEQLIARRSDLTLLTAVDATLGIELARTFRPDVILMDINLPGLSGLEALGVLLKDPCCAYVPILALSANAVPRDIRKGLEAGFFRYLTKPIQVKEFMEALDVALAHGQALRRGQPAPAAPALAD